MAYLQPVLNVVIEVWRNTCRGHLSMHITQSGQSAHLEREVLELPRSALRDDSHHALPILGPGLRCLVRYEVGNRVRSEGSPADRRASGVRWVWQHTGRTWKECINSRIIPYQFTAHVDVKAKHTIAQLRQARQSVGIDDVWPS